MHNSRKRPRKNTPHVVNAIDVAAKHSLGRVVDITAEGMMLVTKEPLQIGERFTLQLNLPVMVQYRSEVEVEAVVRWTAPDNNPEFKRAGFQFVDIENEDGLLLEEVMHKLNLVG
jgi:c-di-GMP-binding flagellar brake protein YcgR